MDNYSNKNIGEKVRQARVLANITLKELSTKTSIKIPTLSRIENGKRSVSVNEVMKISKVTNKPISFFFENIDNNGEDFNSYKILEYFHPSDYKEN